MNACIFKVITITYWFHFGIDFSFFPPPKHQTISRTAKPFLTSWILLLNFKADYLGHTPSQERAWSTFSISQFPRPPLSAQCTHISRRVVFGGSVRPVWKLQVIKKYSCRLKVHVFSCSDIFSSDSVGLWNDGVCVCVCVCVSVGLSVCLSQTGPWKWTSCQGQGPGHFDPFCQVTFKRQRSAYLQHPTLTCPLGLMGGCCFPSALCVSLNLINQNSRGADAWTECVNKKTRLHTYRIRLLLSCVPAQSREKMLLNSAHMQEEENPSP